MSLFPNGYISLLKFYLSNADNEMAQGCKKLNLAKMRTHEKVNAIILLKLKMNQRDWDFEKLRRLLTTCGWSKEVSLKMSEEP